MAKLDYATAAQYARDITVTAMEEGYIPKNRDEKETAKSVSKFFKTVANNLSKK